jgi:hypothetical protein
VTSRRPVRKVLTLVAALTVVGAVLWFRSQATVMSGTKATFSFVGTTAVPAGGPGGPTRATTATTTAVPAATTTMTVGGR